MPIGENQNVGKDESFGRKTRHTHTHTRARAYMPWNPSAPPSKRESPRVRLDAQPAFGAAVVVDTTRAEVRQLVRRMRAESAETLRTMSNERFRRCVSADVATLASDSSSEAWERYCGDVVVFYCLRHVLDGRDVPEV
jgi:hypothetical protein